MIRFFYAIAITIILPHVFMRLAGTNDLDAILITPVLAVLVGVIWLVIHWAIRSARAPLPPPQLLRVYMATGLVALATPFLLFEIAEYQSLYARIPPPLRASTIEFRDDYSAGGFPGDAEAGFFVYRLDETSAALARDQGLSLGGALPGGWRKWRPTPINWSDLGVRPPERGNRPPVRVSFNDYAHRLDAYLNIPKAWTEHASRVADSPGATYIEGRNSLMIVDPACGLVFFSYVKG